MSWSEAMSMLFTLSIEVCLLAKMCPVIRDCTPRPRLTVDFHPENNFEVQFEDKGMSPPQELQAEKKRSNKLDKTTIEDIKPPVTRNGPPTHLADLPLEAGFQSDDDVEFPHIPGADPLIPHIIHMIWMTGNESYNAHPAIPERFVDNVKSFLHHNPNWTYYIWTDHPARKLISERHKQLLHVYDNAPKVVVKTDILRYVLMYEFGGVYTDLDTVNLRPLDIATTKFPCILLPIPFEQAVIWTNMPFRLCNGGMLCRPKHPFFRQCLDALQNRTMFSFFPKIAGPLFIDEQYKLYQNISQEDTYKIDMHQGPTTPYVYKGNITRSENDTVFIPSTKYFLDSPSPSLKGHVSKLCNKTDLSNLQMRACTNVDRLGYERGNKFTFIRHKFAASWMGENAKRLELVPLRNITEKLTLYG